MHRLRALRDRAWWRLLLLPLFVPLVAVTQTGAAAAAPVVVTSAADTRTVDSASLSLSLGTFQPKVKCNFVHRVDGGLYSIDMGAFCEMNPWTGGSADFLRDAFSEPEADLSVWVDIVSNSGVERRVARTAGFTPRVHDSVFTQSALFSIGSVPLAAGDVVRTVCMQYKRDNRWDIDYLSEVGCVSVNLAGEQVQCGNGLFVERPRLAETLRVEENDNGRYHWPVVDVEFEARNSTPEPVTLYHYTVKTGVVDVPGASGITFSSPLVNPVAQDRLSSPARSTGFTLLPGESRVVTVPVAVGPQLRTTGPVSIPTVEVIGAGLFRDTGSGSWSSWGVVPGPTGQPLEAKIGRSDVSVCSYYWGTKLWDNFQPGGPDEPLGPLDPPPVEAPPLPDGTPEVKDEPGFWNAVLGLLRLLISAVGAVVSAVASVVSAIAGLVGQLVDALRDLFIPSGDPFSGVVSDFRESVDDSRLGEWSDALSAPFGAGGAGSAGVPGGAGVSGAGSPALDGPSGVAPASSPGFGGGCQGPGIDISRIIPAGMGSQFNTLHPFEACEGVSAQMASYSRLIAGVLVGLFGGLKMLAMFQSSALGMRNTQILSNYDWSQRF